MNNKRALVNWFKDIVLETCVRIFCTALFTNNNIKVVIQIDTLLAHLKTDYHCRCHICRNHILDHRSLKIHWKRQHKGITVTEYKCQVKLFNHAYFVIPWDIYEQKMKLNVLYDCIYWWECHWTKWFYMKILWNLSNVIDKSRCI